MPDNLSPDNLTPQSMPDTPQRVEGLAKVARGLNISSIVCLFVFALGFLGIMPDSMGLVIVVVLLVGALCGVIGIILSCTVFVIGRSAAITTPTRMGLGIVGLIVSLAVLSAILGPTIMHARELAKRAQCRSNLQTIAAALSEYGNANSGVLPPSLNHLADTNLISVKTLTCPAAAEKGAGGYFYLPPAETAEPETIVACDVIGNHRDGRNVLLNNGVVRWASSLEFDDMLTEPRNSAFANALRRAESKGRTTQNSR